MTRTPPTITLHHNDLPADVVFTDGLMALDTETLGLNPLRDRLCVCQVGDGKGRVWLVQFDGHDWSAPNLRRHLEDPKTTKIFHFGRFDIAVLGHYLGCAVAPVYCTKIASRLTRTYTDRHGLKDLCSELLGVSLDKQQQTSHWAASTLSPEQQAYAASDVLHLHALKAELDARLADLGRSGIAQACFDFLPTRAALDIAGWENEDIFSHSAKRN